MDNHVIVLYEMSGYTARDWVDGHHKVFCYDILHRSAFFRDGQTFLPWDARDPEDQEKLIRRHKGKAKILIAMPPCTDLAVSGAKHFVRKELENPGFQDRAMELVFIAIDLAERLGCPWAIENPVSVISSKYRSPDHIFDPYEYGGYLPEDDVHPKWPRYIKPRDAYPKRTRLWIGGGFKIPQKRPVPILSGWSTQQLKLGGTSARTKEVRSASPRGFFRAVYKANQHG